MITDTVEAREWATKQIMTIIRRHIPRNVGWASTTNLAQLPFFVFNNVTVATSARAPLQPIAIASIAAAGCAAIGANADGREEGE